MELKEIAQEYETILQKEFPSIIVRIDPEIGNFEGGRLAAFGVKDKEAVKFLRYIVDELPEKLTIKGLPEIIVLIHNMSTTKENYPQQYKEVKTLKENIINSTDSNDVEFISFYDLTEKEQKEQIDNADKEYAENNQYFYWNDTVYSLDQFIRTNNEYDGTMGLTNTSALGLKINMSGDGGTITLL